MPCLTLLSFEKIGSAIKDIKDLNNLSSDQRNMKNDLFGGLVTEIAKNKDGLSIDEQINKMQKSKLNPAVINDAMTLAVNQPESSFENKGNEVSEALRKHDISASFESINNSADSATEAMKRFNNNANLEKAEKSTTSFASKFKTHVGGGVEKVHTKFSNGITKTKAKLGELKTSLSNIGTGLKETMVANLPAVLLAAGTAAAAGVNALANNIRSRALNAGTKNLDKYNKKINKSQNKLDSVNNIKAEFNRLAKGVDNTTNQNVGLSESDYSRYLELKKQLVKTNKDLVKSMDSEGNAIIDNNSAIDKSIKKYERQIQKNKQAIVSKKNLAIQNKAAALNMNKTTEGNRVGDRSLTGNVGRLLTGGKKGVGIGGALIGGAIGTLIAPGAGTAIGAVIGNGAQAAANLGGQLLLGTKDSGAIHSIFASKKSIQSDGLNSNKSNLISMIKNTKAYKKEAKSILGKNADLDNLTDQQLSTLLNNANFESGGLGVKDNTMSKYVEATKSNLKEVQDQLKEFKSTTLENTLEASQGFATLDKTSQQFAKNYVSNMDLSSDKMSGKDATKYLEEQEQKVRSFTNKLSTDTSLKDAYKSFTDIKGDTSKSATEWQQEINKRFKTLKKKTGMSNKELSGALGISLSGDNVLTSDGQNVQKMINKLNSEFKGQVSKQEKTISSAMKESTISKLISNYQTQKSSRLSNGSSKQGNVDLNGRPVLLNKDKSYSTLLSSSMAGADGSAFEGKEIMYTPVLASSGKKLDEKTMQEYITQITSKASSKEELLKLDSKGLEIGGQKVKNVIEGVANSVDEANKKTEDFHKNNENGYTEEAKSLQKIKDYMIKQGGDYAKLGEKLNSSVDFDKIFGKGYFENLSLDQLSEAYDLITDKNEIFTGSLDQLKQRLDNVAKYKDSGLSYTLDSYTQATKSADDDANYNTFVSGLKSAKDEWDKGKVGTDQFKQMAGLISPTGKTDDKNFKENYDHIMKYFTSDDSGPKAFVSQLRNMTNASGEAMATLDKKTGDYKVNIDNTAKAAKKMGMGLVPFESMLDNLKTYGWKVDYSSLTEQWDDASTKLNEWSQIWEKNGGSLGDSQGKEIEDYKQKLEEFRKEGEKLPDNWEKTLTIKVNAAEATTKLTNAVDDYKQRLKDNGDGWAKSSEAKKARQEIFDSGSSATTKAEKAQEATLKEDGLKTNQKYKTERDKADKEVQDALAKAKKSGSAKDMDAYQKTVQDRNDLISKGATDDKYYVKTQFKNRNDVNKELKRNGATVDKDGNVTAGKGNKKDIQTIIDSYNKDHKRSEIKVTWAGGKSPDTKPKKNESDTKSKKSESGSKDSTSSKNEKSKTEPKTETSGKDSKTNKKEIPDMGVGSTWAKWIQSAQNAFKTGSDKSKNLNSPALPKTKDNTSKEQIGVSWGKWFQQISGQYKEGSKKASEIKSPAIGNQNKKDNSKTQDVGTGIAKAIQSAISSIKKSTNDQKNSKPTTIKQQVSKQNESNGKTAQSILGSFKGIGKWFSGLGLNGVTGKQSKSPVGGSTQALKQTGKTIQNATQTSTKKQSSKSDVKVNAKGNAKKTIDFIKKSLSSMKSKSISIKVKGNAKKTISSISKSLKKLKSKSISIKVKGNASSVIKKIASALKKLKNKTITVKVKDSASHKISSIKGKLNALGKMHPTPKVTINTSGLEQVRSAKSTIDGLHDKSVKVSVNYSQSGSKPTKAYGTFARGTMAWSTAYARGTMNALAGGNIGAKTSGKTLVGEVGVEGIIRKNSQRMELLGTTGPEFTDIHSGDIVFNHQQTADLLANGHTSTRAKVQGGMSAFAHGTSFKALASGQSATASGGWRGGIAEKSSSSSKKSSSTKKHTSSTKSNTKATNKNTSSKKKNTKATDKNTKKKSKLATLIDSVGKQFDFIAIKLDRASAATEKFANMINDYVSSSTKTKALWNQYKSVGKEISTNKKAASKYKSAASSFASKAISKAPKTKKTSKKQNQAKLRKYFARVRNGSLNINTISNDNLRSAVEQYQTLWENYLKCNEAAQQLKNTQRELFNQWLNMPIEKAQASIDRQANKFGYLSARTSAASTGESGVNALRFAYQEEVDSNKKNVASKKTARDKAKKADVAAKNNVKKAQSTQKKAKKTQTSKAKSAKKAISSQKGLSNSKKKSLSSKISKGQKISTKGLKGNAKKQANAYNKSVDTKKKADKNVTSKKNTQKKTSKNLKSAQSNLNSANSKLKAIETLQNQAVKESEANSPAYVYQNKLLKQQTKNKQDDYNDNRKAQKTVQKNYDKYNKKKSDAEKSLRKAQNKVKNKKSSAKKAGSKITSTKGFKKLSKTQQNKIKKQINSGKKISTKGIKGKNTLSKIKAYNKAIDAVSKAKKAEASASKKVSAASRDESDAKKALETANNNAKQSAAELAEAKVNEATQSQANIKAYYDAKQNYESIQGNNASSAAKLKQAKGEDLTTEDYQKQIDSNEKQAKLYEESAKTMQEKLDGFVKDGTIKKGSQEWMQMQGEIDACTSSAADLRTTNEELKNSMRDDVYYRGFERAIKAAQNLQNSLTTISSLIDEDAMFDEDGNLTDYGTAAIATNIANVRSEKEELQELLKQREELASHKDEYSDTEWAEAIQKSDQDIADAVKSIKSAEDSVTTILKNNAKQKLDAINKTIDAYRDCLNMTKSYYEYDKQLKSSNKEIQILKSKQRALEGVNTAEAKAEKRRLEAELEEKQDSLNDTIKEHIYSIQIDGLDKLSTQLSEDYDKYCKELSSSVDKIEETFTSLSGTITSESDKIDSTIRNILHHYGVDDPSTIGATTDKLPGYAQGGLVKSVHKNGDDGLASLAVGEEVATVDVVNLANKIRQDKVLNALANGHTLNGMTMDKFGNMDIAVNFGEAIGNINIPEGVTSQQLQRIINETYQYTSQKVIQDVTKAFGRKRPV
nr:MAG TPA: hypothetical protein [Bacteriophage sp.]